jgi:predicted branched-subunit amino acid permease
LPNPPKQPGLTQQLARGVGPDLRQAPAPPILAIASATIIVNLRYVLMATMLRDLFRDATQSTALPASFLLCDESCR